MSDERKARTNCQLPEIDLEELETIAGGGLANLFVWGLEGVGSRITGVKSNGGAGMYAPVWDYSKMMEREMARDERADMAWANMNAPSSGNSGAEESFNAGAGGFFGEE